MAKLGMAQRLGIVLSIAWAVGAGAWQRAADVEHGKQAYSRSLDYCYKLASQPGALTEHTGANFLRTDCFNTAADIQASYQNYRDWQKVLAIALSPVAAAWLAAVLLIGIGRWILAGRGERDRRPD